MIAAIMAEDWMLVAMLVGGTAVIVSLLWIAYGANRTWDLKLEHAEHIRMMNAEITMVRSTLSDRAMRDRVMGSVPVGRLLDGGG